MKPKDLKPLAKWANRHIYIQDRVWCIPEYYDKYQSFTFPGWSDPSLFGNDLPVSVEYCSGNGTWIAAKALEQPHRNWVAVERRFDRVRKIWSKIKNMGLKNLIVIWGEALVSTQQYFPAQSIEEVFINFPDPWPKKRHAKHRLIQDSFVSQVNRILHPNATINIVTDDPTYSSLLISVVLEGGFNPAYPSPHYVTDFPGYGSSFFEELWRQKGGTIRYHRFVRNVAPSER